MSYQDVNLVTSSLCMGLAFDLFFLMPFSLQIWYLSLLYLIEPHNPPPNITEGEHVQLPISPQLNFLGLSVMNAAEKSIHVDEIFLMNFQSETCYVTGVLMSRKSVVESGPAA